MFRTTSFVALSFFKNGSPRMPGNIAHAASEELASLLATQRVAASCQRECEAWVVQQNAGWCPPDGSWLCFDMFCKTQSL